MELDHHHLLLVQKSLSGVITPLELETLNQWIKASPDHARLMAEYRLLWEAVTPSRFDGAIDLDEDFARVMQRIQQDTVPAEPMRISRFSRRRLWQVAAVLLSVLATVWLFRMYNVAPALQTIVSVTTQQQVNLPDGTEVWLAKGATIRYPSAFTGKVRKVQIEGLAYFEVAHNAQKTFTVELPNGAQVSVLGTEFGVQSNPGENASVVLVKSGQVRLSAPGSESALLTAGQRAEYHVVKKSITVSRPGSLNELAWHAGGLEFVNTPLQRVLEDIRQFYQVDVTMRNPDLADCPYTAPLTNQSVEDVLRSIAQVFDMRLNQPAPKQFILQGGNCR